MRLLCRWFAVLLLLGSGCAFGQTAFYSVPISFVVPGWNGEGFYMFSTQNYTAGACSTNAFIIPTAHSYRKELENMLLVATMTKAPVDMIVNCVNGQLQVVSIYLHAT